MSQAFNFVAGTQNHAFLMSNNGFDYLQGPIGSGKTKTFCVRLMRHAQQQARSPKDGLRYSRFFICRNSMPILKLSTIRTWLETFPEATFGKFNFGTPMGHRIEYGDVRTQFDFISLDNEDDIKRMRSTEYTGGFFNEGSFTEKALVDEAQSRLRYPPREHGGPTWAGIIIDGNAPSEDHWPAMMSGQVDPPAGASPEELEKFTWPSTWGLYLQPPALIARFDERGQILSYDINNGQDPRWPRAENIENLPDDYYAKMLPAKSRGWIDSHLMNKVAFVVDGAPVWPMFRREYHVAREALSPVRGHTVIVGLDFGRVFPAAVFAQEISGRIYIQHEILGFNEGPRPLLQG